MLRPKLVMASTPSHDDTVDALACAILALEVRKDDARKELSRVQREMLRVKRGFLLVEVAKMSGGRQQRFRRMYSKTSKAFTSAPLSEIIDGMLTPEVDRAVSQVIETIKQDNESKEDPSDEHTQPTKPG